MERHKVTQILQKLIQNDMYGAVDDLVKSVQDGAYPTTEIIIPPSTLKGIQSKIIPFIKVLQSVVDVGLAEGKRVADTGKFIGSVAHYNAVMARENEWLPT